MKDTIIEIKNNLQGINSRVDETKIQIINLEYKKAKSTNQNSKKKKNPKSEDNVRRLWDNFKHTKICIMGVMEGEEREQEIGNAFEKIMTENFPNLVKEITCKSRKHRESKKR